MPVKYQPMYAQCATQVDRSAVRREVIDGVEHVIINSYTMPDDIVMNGVLYPAAEIEKSYTALERTLAPVEHPKNSAGQYISATDPVAIHNYYAGAFNANVRREGKRVRVDKVINVAEAKKSERGRRLLDRINELETNADPRPIHTSTGVFIDAEPVPSPQTNAAGQEYTLIAHNIRFDHDAILLDSIGAAQPAQGVGMAVNHLGETVPVSRFEANATKAARNLPLAPTDTTWDKSAADKRVRAHVGAEDAPNATYARYHLWYDAEDAENFGAYKLGFVDIVDGRPMAVPNALRNAAARLTQTQGPSATEQETIRGIIEGYLSKLRANQDQSHSELHAELFEALNRPPMRADWVAEVYDDRVIFSVGEDYFEVPYTVGNDTVTISGIPTPVERVVTFAPRTNSKEGNQMRDLMLQVLAKAGVTVNADISDNELLAKYNQMSQDAIADVVTNAVKPLAERLDGIEAAAKAVAAAEVDQLATVVVNSGKYPALTVEEAKKLSVDALRGMAAATGQAHGLPLVNQGSGAGAADPFTMPQ